MQIKLKGRLPIIILGDSKVGKTSIINQYVNAKFSEKYRATIGADYLPKKMMIYDQMVTLEIWDVAGLERIQSLGAAFFRGADCCVLVYDITNQKSFGSLNSLRDDFLELSQKDREKFPFMILGNKLDKESQRLVHKAEVEAWCKPHENMQFQEVSAKDATSIEQAFYEIAKTAEKYAQNQLETFQLQNQNPQNQSKQSKCF